MKQLNPLQNNKEFDKRRCEEIKNISTKIRDVGYQIKIEPS